MTTQADSSRIFFTSDIHFGHTNIIQYCKRPFESVSHMNNSIIERWNSVVGGLDLVYVLGDVCMGPLEETVRLVSRLHGRKVLIKGNHDDRSVKMLEFSRQWESIHDYLELSVGKQLIVMSHYPLASWHKANRGSYMLHGHCHHSYKPGLPTTTDQGKVLDVGLDGQGYNYAPISLNKVNSIMGNKMFMATDHHVQSSRHAHDTEY